MNKKSLDSEVENKGSQNIVLQKAGEAKRIAVQAKKHFRMLKSDYKLARKAYKQARKAAKRARKKARAFLKLQNAKLKLSAKKHARLGGKNKGLVAAGALTATVMPSVSLSPQTGTSAV